MDDDQHSELLWTLSTLKANIMISTRQNDLYDRLLSSWRKKEFGTSDHGGAVNEIIYMNYEEPEYLHEYTFVGDGYVDRQRVKRKAQRFSDKLSTLAAYERHIYIQELIKSYPEDVQTMLSITAVR